MKLGKTHKGSHEINRFAVKADTAKVPKTAPLRGLLVMVGSCVAFLAFLALITVAIHFIML